MGKFKNHRPKIIKIEPHDDEEELLNGFDDEAILNDNNSIRESTENRVINESELDINDITSNNPAIESNPEKINEINSATELIDDSNKNIEDELEEGEIVDSSESDDEKIIELLPINRKRKNENEESINIKKPKIAQVVLETNDDDDIIIIDPPKPSTSIPEPKRPVTPPNLPPIPQKPIVPSQNVTRHCYGYFVPKSMPSYDELQRFYMQSLAMTANPHCPAAREPLPSVIEYNYYLSNTYKQLYENGQKSE